MIDIDRANKFMYEGAWEIIHWNYSISRGGTTVHAAECVTYFFFFPFPPGFFFALSLLLDEVNDSAQYSAHAGSGITSSGTGNTSSGSSITLRTPNVALYGAIAGGGTFGGEYGIP